MKKLSIKIVRSSDNVVMEHLISDHADITQRSAIFYNVYKAEKDYYKEMKVPEYCVPALLDHWNIMFGIITLYYRTGFEIEIARIND